MGKLELNPMDYDVASLINDAVQLNIVRIASKPIEFILNIDGNMPAKLCGDELRIKQILSNLLSNAIKYTEKGSVKLSVSHLLQDGDVELRFAVEDTGQGIKPDDQKRLFAEFTRFNKESNRATEGTGLGLSIAKRLAEMMDGAIEVKSEYGKGSVFTVKLKQKIKEHGVIGEETADRLRNFTFAGGRQLKEIYVRVQPMPYGKVLVVDDVDTNLYVAAGLLAKYGLDIETANSGFGAIEKINAGKTYDVIFMDQMMPKMDGIETAEKLRALGYKGAIVALTANALAGNHEMFMQKGFDGFIPKPIDIRQLDAVLVRFVRERHPEAANAPELPGSEPGESKRYKQADAETAPEIFRIFCGDAKKAAETLRETLENGDMKLFALTAHAMKSALANVGEYDMSGQASDLEVAGTYGDTGYILERTESFAEKLEALISKFNPADQSSASDADISENKTYLIEQLQIVKSACEDYNANAVYAALDLMSQEKITKISMKTAGELEKIRDMLFIYSEFDEAAEAAGELIKKLDLRGDKKTTE
jgi:CheY-like chemotaxis protein/anti-sigma regulatory factor (Ser/Thr protein kinase)/HPt (histidine-containing phosphotransfer) domain-containing protein